MADAHTTREAWLLAATQLLRPMLDEVGAPEVDYTKIRVTMGFPSVRAMSMTAPRIGECWPKSSSADEATEIMISPRLAAPVQVLDTLLHELCHAVLPPGAGHKAPFVKLARALGMEGKPTATFAGPALKTKLEGLAGQLGALPHGAITGGSGSKKQSTRMLKCLCKECGYTVRLSAKWLEVGPPICPTDELTMVEG